MSLRSVILSPSFGALLKKTAPSMGFVSRLSSSSAVGLSNGRRTGSVLCFSTAVTVTEKDMVLFQPFEEAKKLAISPQATSLARQFYSDECEAALNEQINVLYSVSYVYTAMQAYLERDNVSLKGIAGFFQRIYVIKRLKAQRLMAYQNKRGGRVKLNTIVAPPSEFESVEKGDALYAMELALSLEKLCNEKLHSLHAIANSNNDPAMAEYIESIHLRDQVTGIDILSKYVSQLRRIGKGDGVWKFDKEISSNWVSLKDF